MFSYARSILRSLQGQFSFNFKALYFFSFSYSSFTYIHIKHNIMIQWYQLIHYNNNNKINGITKGKMYLRI